MDSWSGPAVCSLCDRELARFFSVLLLLIERECGYACLSPPTPPRPCWRPECACAAPSPLSSGALWPSSLMRMGYTTHHLRVHTQESGPLWQPPLVHQMSPLCQVGGGVGTWQGRERQDPASLARIPGSVPGHSWGRVEVTLLPYLKPSPGDVSRMGPPLLPLPAPDSWGCSPGPSADASSLAVGWLEAQGGRCLGFASA